MVRHLQFLSISLLLAGAAAAQGVQNMDISILLGPVPASSQVVSGTTVSAGAGVSFLLAYGYQLHAYKVADLYLDMPLAWKFYGSATVSRGSVLALANDRFYFTPGVRAKFNLHSRVALFLVGGAGYGSSENYSTQVASGGVTVTAGRIGQLFGEVGGGMDLRLTKLLSLRIEEREFFRTDKASGIFGVGLALHF